MKGHLAVHHDYAIVVEAERGDHAALAIYNNALNAGLPPEALRLIQTQKAGVQAALASLQGSMLTA